MEHHRMKHEMKKEPERKREHRHHEAMIDDRMVKDNHQEGIKRVLQRRDEAGRVGQPGKMVSKGHANWKRPNTAATPRKA